MREIRSPLSGFRSPFGSRRGEFDPISLFEGGVSGALYDYSDDAAVFQDTSATTPAGNGDPVARLLDLSGNGKHLTRSVNDASRPVRTLDANGWHGVANGTSHCLLSTANTFNFSASGEFWMIVAHEPGAAASRVVADLSASSIRRILLRRTDAFCRPASTETYTAYFTQTARQIVSLRFIRATSTLVVYVNGAESSRRPLTSASFYAGTQTLSLHASNFSTDFSASKIWTTLLIGRALSFSEHMNVVAWMAGKANIDTFGMPGTQIGAHTWFTEVSTIRAGGKTVLGITDGHGMERAMWPDANGRVIEGVNIDPAAWTTFQRFTDDHGNPTFIKRSSDDRLLAYSIPGHNLPTLYQYLSTNPDDPTAWGSRTNLASSLGVVFFAYPQPVELEGESGSPIYLFFRAAINTTPTDWGPYYAVSTDQGASWSAATKYIAGSNRPYIKLAKNGTDRIDFVVNDGNPTTLNTNLYHFYMEGGAFYSTTGTSLTLPINLALLTPFHTYSVSEGKGWQWDIKIDANGHPVILYVRTFSASDHRYSYARWNGSSWVKSNICNAGGALYAGQPDYSGGICFDTDDLNVVFASRESGGVWQVWKYTSPDDGVTWDAGVQLTSTRQSNFRPRIVAGAPEPRLAVLRGRYRTYEDFDCAPFLLNSETGA